MEIDQTLNAFFESYTSSPASGPPSPQGEGKYAHKFMQTKMDSVDLRGIWREADCLPYKITFHIAEKNIFPQGKFLVPLFPKSGRGVGETPQTKNKQSIKKEASTRDASFWF